MTRKLTSNDKILENIHIRVDTIASTIKNQQSFNKMLESQFAQLAIALPPLEEGKIGDLGRPIIPISIGCHSFQTVSLTSVQVSTICPR